jgi:hypothetical protein
MPNAAKQKAMPEMVSPLVLYLCSDVCQDTGLIFNAGGGFYNRAALVSGKGISLARNGSLPTVEDIHENWSEITEVGDQMFRDVKGAILYMMGSILAETDSPD